MLKTRFFLAAFVLAAVFLVSASVKAEIVVSNQSTYADFSFYLMEEGIDEYSGGTYVHGGGHTDLHSHLNLRAWDGYDVEKKLDGVYFEFTSNRVDVDENGDSTWAIWNQTNGTPTLSENSAYLIYHGDPLGYSYKADGSGHLNDTGDNLLPIVSRSGGVVKLSDGIWGSTFFIGYNSGYDWSDFTDTVRADENYFGFRITISENNSLTKPTKQSTYQTYQGDVLEQAPSPTPEPATLLILGGGLAGLGIAARRRKK